MNDLYDQQGQPTQCGNDLYKDAEDRKAYTRRCMAVQLSIQSLVGSMTTTTLLERAEKILKFLNGEANVT